MARVPLSQPEGVSSQDIMRSSGMPANTWPTSVWTTIWSIHARTSIFANDGQLFR